MARKMLNRRTLLKSAALAAAPMVLPGSAFGANAPSNRVNLAAIGVGSRGGGLVGEFIHLEAAQYLAVCDCFADRRTKMRDSMNAHYQGDVVTACQDFREVLARDDIDAIVVATPDHWHVPIAIAAARAGKDMYIEKPLGVSMAWAKVLRKAVARHNRIFQYGTQQRSMSFYRRVWQLVRNGYIGDVERVDAWCPDISSQYDLFNVKPNGSTEPAPVPDGLDYDMWLGPAPESPYTVDRCTPLGTYHHHDNSLGFIAGWGAHPLDAVQWVLGRDDTSPVRYEGTGSVPYTGLCRTIDSWDMHCAYADGLPIHFMGHRVAEPVVKAYRPQFSPNGITFFGSEGWASCDRGAAYASDPKLVTMALPDTDTHPGYTENHALNFIESVRNREPAISPLEAAIRSDTISHLSDIAIRLGRGITWDPEKERIQNDAEANEHLVRPLRAPWDLSKPMVTAR